MRPTAAIITVGTELVSGLRLDTNTRDIASHLTGLGFDVVEAMSVGDDIARLTAATRRLVIECSALVITGGLGPTHDDITREGVSAAMGRPLVVDPDIEAGLSVIASRHHDADAAAQVSRQAEIVQGATVIPATSGTAPGQIIEADGCRIVMLPGPPHEMRPMLKSAFDGVSAAALPVILRCVWISESDAQVRAQRALEGVQGVGLTVLASPSLVDVILLDEGGGDAALSLAAGPVEEALGDHCYARGDTTLAEAVLDLARGLGIRLATAESCTGGMIAASLTDPAGASDVFTGGVIAYSNDVKATVLGVDPDVIEEHGAVSEEVACAMATGALETLGADVAVAVTGIAGPGGGSQEKPVGTVWFAVAGSGGVSAEHRKLFRDRDGIRKRAKVAALDLLRRELTRGD